MSNQQQQQNQDVWKQKVDLFRKRFGSREDMFGVKSTYLKRVQEDDGSWHTEEVSLFSPQCKNFGNQSICQISAGTASGCGGCSNRNYQELTDEWVWKHISGQKDLILYLLRHDGIKFGACDFDYGSHFEDAKIVRDFSVKLGLPCYIARSSRKGYHLYWFFKEPVPAHLFTSLVSHIFGEVGFQQRYLANMSVPMPEVFPKQTTFVIEKQGNGIKIPMIEPRMKEGFNCWVTDDSTPIPPEEQWEYFGNMNEVVLETLQKVIEENKVFVSEAPVSASRRSAREGDKGPVEYKPSSPPSGDFLKVVSMCPAMKQFWEQDENGMYKFDKVANNHGVPHMARVASLSFARATTNGYEAIRGRWKSTKTEEAIKYADSSTQHPWTCKAMQDHGLCRVGMHPTKGDHCLKRIPPGEKINGTYVPNPNKLPESEWPDPSPTRYANGFKPYEQIEAELKDLFSFKRDKDNKEIKDAVPPEKFEERFHDLLKSCSRLSPEEYRNIQAVIKSNKFIPVSELKTLEKRAKQEVKAEEHKEKCAATPHFKFGENDFFLNNGKYEISYLDGKGIPHTRELTNFVVEIQEEIVTLPSIDEDEGQAWVRDKDVKSRDFRGIIRVLGEQKTSGFTVAATDWVRSGEGFFSLLINKAGGNLLYNKSDYDHIRNCINFFSRENKKVRLRVKDFGHYNIKGVDTYVTPSVIVTKDQIRPNNGEFDMEFVDENTRDLDFKIIDDRAFKDLALHIITDYFGCNSLIATMTTLAHSLSAAILPQLPLNKSPVLWLDGSFSSGKSFIAEMAQCFYGNFKNLTGGIGSTGKGRLSVAHHFRHAFLTIDDFKSAMSEHNAKEMITFVHTAYDRSGRAALNRDGTLRQESTKIRGLIATTGEDYPIQEASAISRLILVSVGHNQKKIDNGNRVKERKRDYCGFTPHFIQFVYGMDKGEIKKLYTEYYDYFETQSRKATATDSGHRISENLSLNMTTFRLVMELLFSKGVIPAQQKDDFCAKQIRNLEITRANITSCVHSQKGANLFLDELSSLLQDPSKYHITNWPNFDPTRNGNSKPLGFYRSALDPGVVFINPSMAHAEVNTAAHKSGFYLQNKQHIGRQLVEDGHIQPGMYDLSSPMFTKQVRTPTGGKVGMWVIKADSLGLDPHSHYAKDVANKEDLRVTPISVIK